MDEMMALRESIVPRANRYFMHGYVWPCMAQYF